LYFDEPFLIFVEQAINANCI